MKNKETFKKIIFGIGFFVALVVFFPWDDLMPVELLETPAPEKAESGSFVPISSISASEDYGKDFLEFESEFGFSFLYPPHTKIFHFTLGNSYVDILPIEKPENGRTAIVISIGDNDENLTPEEWLLHVDSGFNKNNPYFRTTIDGQDAVYTDGGMWVVVNTPDDKYRLSISELSTGDAPIMFSEMGILVESLKFK